MAAEDRIGRYRIAQLLGRGGMGDVYLAGAQGAAGFEKPVVLKVLRPKYGRDPERIRRLLREAFIGVRLDHQGVVQVLDLGEQEGTWYFVMEYVRGFTLAHLVAHAKPLEANVVAHIGRQVAEALDYVHHVKDEDGQPLGLIHRDISPTNVLLGGDGRIKVSDFGVAILTRDDDDTLAGKPPYLPPEAFRGTAPTQAWDVYALGATLYEALTGHRAVEGDSVREVRAALEQGIRPILELRADCPRGIARLVMQAVHPEPEKRFRTASALRAALEEAVPRRLEDADRHRALVTTVFNSKEFVDRNGPLPTTAGSVGSTPTHLRSRTDTPTLQARPHAALRLGLSPALGAAKARAFGDRIAQRLRSALGREVRAMVVADYQVLIDCMVSGEVDLAWMPPAAFVDARKQGARALVIAERLGRITYESALVVKAGSPLQRLEDLRGRSVAWVDRASSGGYLFAVAEVMRVLGRPAEVFSQQHFHGSHRAVCEAVANGWADVGATYAVRDGEGAVRASGWLDLLGPRAAELRPIAWSVPIPGDNIAYAPHLPVPTIGECAGALAALSGDEEGKTLLREVFNADAFVHCDEDVYEDVRSALALARQAE